MNSYDLESFVQELTTYLQDERPLRLMVEAAAESLRRLVGGALYLDERFLRSAREAPSRHQLFADPAGRFRLFGVAWPPGYATPVHDHGTWGVIVGYRGRVIVTTYRRTDDGTVEGSAQVSELTRTLISDGGAVALVRPPEEEVHRIENPYREPAITVHLYGEDRPWPHIFSVAEGKLSIAGGPAHFD